MGPITETTHILHKFFATFCVVITTLVASAILGEALLRVTSTSQQKYTIEMWRYAKDLKKISADPNLGHIHIPNSTATLQGTKFRINSLGMRGAEPELAHNSRKRILFLGSSITLGWGVPENQTMPVLLGKFLGDDTLVMNGGIGNYNTARSVARFNHSWRQGVKPDVVIVNYFLNDAEILPPSQQNILFKHSQLAVTLYYIYQGFVKGSADLSALKDHYQAVYADNSPGLNKMQAALSELNKMAIEDGFQIVFTMMPDVHNLKEYPFSFAHAKMKELVQEFNWVYIDFLDDLKKFNGPELWTIPGDPHPNGIVHKIMAERLTPIIRNLANNQN